ncbi:hypothetical protein [Megamonas hypermegale]|jgi:hypothetical protein|uniref:hypothetical protein n=1 Tax=Megamonas hypermegale TaxID=158847 RepID=UPI00320B30CE
MANECETSIVFYSEHKAMIKDLWRNIISFCKDNHDCTIYKFMQKRGYSKNDLYQSDKRGAITYCDSSVTYKDDIVYFKIETVSAWMPQVDEFYKLIDEKYDRKISIVFETEEMGCGIYYNTDIEGRFFRDRYKIDYCLKQDTIRYFERFDDAIDYIKEVFPKAKVSIFDDINIIEGKVQSAYNMNEDNEFFFNFKRFEYQYPF